MLSELGNLGARTRPFNVGLREQVVVIGLGQVGLAAVAKLQTMLEYSLPPRQRQEHIRLLAIAARKSIRQEQMLVRENRLLLKLDAIRWSDIPGRYQGQGVAKWWAKTPNHPHLQNDPSQARPYGRLLLWANVEVLGEKLFELAEWLYLSSERHRQGRSILILGSLTEAESSAMLFDVAGRMRYQLQAWGVKVVGVLTADSTAETEEARLVAMAMAYATLKELDAACVQPEIYPHDLPLTGKAKNIARGPAQSPFDQICITGDAQRPQGLSPEGPVAEFALTWLLSLLGQGPNVDLLPPPGPMAAGQSVQTFDHYSSFGVAKLSLPVRDAMNYYALTSTKKALQYLLRPYPEPVEGMVQKVLARAHTDLLTQGLTEHHLLTDRLRELNRYLASANLIARVKRSTQSNTDWRAFFQHEWHKLEGENRAQTLDKDGVPTRLETLRRRMEDAMEEGFRKFSADVEQLAVNLAFAEGWGLDWTRRVFLELAAQMKQSVQKLQERSHMARLELERQSQPWINTGAAKNGTLMDKLTPALIEGLVQWVGWEVRAVYWAEALKLVEDLRGRLEAAIQQIPLEVKQLEQRGAELKAELEATIGAEPVFPAGAFLTDSWMKDGTKNIPAMDDIPPHEVIASLFKRWEPGDTPPPRQIQRFPAELLNAMRLTLQPHATFLNLHDLLMQNSESPAFQRLIDRLGLAAAPLWTVSAMTDRLDKPFSPPLPVDIVREPPNPFSLVPVRDPQRIRRVSVASPDIDEVVNIRVMHGWSAQYVQRLRNEYRRAYSRVLSDNIPLHIDRRWESTMADLVHTTIRFQIGNLWDEAVNAARRGSRYAHDPVEKLSRSIAGALEVPAERVQRPSPLAEDIQLYLYPLEPFRLKIPPPLCSFIYLLSQRSTAELSEDLFRTVSAVMPDENFFIVVDLTERNDLGRILDSLREQGFLPMLLNESDVKHIVSAPKPSFALRDLVIERIDLSAISPFYTRAPVPDHMFFGREKEIADVRSKLNTHSVVLIGGRRIGKTSSLQKINRALTKTQDSPTVPYYMDCSNFLKHRHFFRRMMQDWEVEVDDIDDPFEFDQVVRQLQKRHLTKTPIFLLDEVDRLLKTDQGDNYDEPLFRTFRSISNEKRAQFVFSGEKLLLGSLNNAKSVLFNFPQKVRLSPLEREVVRRLISEPFEMLNIWLEDMDTLVQQVYEISAGHPNIVQTICHALVEVVDQDKSSSLLTLKHLNQVLALHAVQTDIVETIWGQMDPLAKLTTLLWPDDTRRLSLEHLIELLQKVGVKALNSQEVKEKIVPDLILYNFIQQEGQYYTLIPTRFPKLLGEMTNKGLEVQSILHSYSREQ